MADPPLVAFGLKRESIVNQHRPLRHPDRVIRRRLWLLRGMIRAHVGLLGVATLLVCVALAFWISLGIDWLLEPSLTMRRLLVGGFLIAGGFCLYAALLRRLFAPLGNRRLARLLEARFPELGGAMLTAVETQDRVTWPASPRRAMAGHAAQDAARRVRKLWFSRLFQFQTLARMTVAALALVSSVAAFQLFAEESFGIWYARAVRLQDLDWPRRTRLLAEGFEEGRVKVARGDDFTLTILADTRKIVPEVVRVRYETDEGLSVRDNMTQQGVAVPGIDAFQRFTYRFNGVLSSVTLDAWGGDDQLRGLTIEVVESPTIAGLEVDCVYPDYLERPVETGIRASSALRFPQGSRLTFHAVTNKPLLAVEARLPAAGSDTTDRRETLTGEDIDGAAFTYALAELTTDRFLEFVLTDVDKITSRQPLRLHLTAIPDQPPKVSFRLQGIGRAVTPQARIPLAGKIEDDYGVAQAWTEYRIDGGAAEKMDVPLTQGTTEQTAVFDTRDLSLQPGQKLSLAVVAADRRALGDGPQTGRSAQYQFDIVTPGELRELLERRELILRQQLEGILERLAETRESLLRFEVAGPPSDSTTSSDGPAAVPSESPSDTPVDEEAQRAIKQLNGLRVRRAIQETERNASETGEVLDGIRGILAELENNRVDAADLRDRLTTGVATPLQVSVEGLFGRAQEALKPLSPAPGQIRPDALARDQAVRRLDAVALELRKALDAMIELESFTEILDLLREIIQEQETLREKTEERRRQKVTELLEGL